MTWILNASGHCASKADEAALIVRVAEEFADPTSAASSASLSTQYHGVVNLCDAEAVAKATEPQGA